jgi:hypothetical protein
MQSLVASIPDSSTGEDVAAKQRTTAGTVNCQGGTISIYKLNCRLLKHIYKKNTHSTCSLLFTPFYVFYLWSFHATTNLHETTIGA